MHYILNALFKVNKKPTKVTSDSRDKNFFKYDKEKFKEGETYKLVFIKKHENGMAYTFETTKGQLVEEIFSSTNEADKFIAYFRNEQLPNYPEFYKKMR